MVKKVAYINIRLEIILMALPKVVLPTYELELPSNGKKIKYRPFVVKEEKLLLLALETNDEKEIEKAVKILLKGCITSCLLYTSPSPRDKRQSRMPSSA